MIKKNLLNYPEPLRKFLLHSYFSHTDIYDHYLLLFEKKIEAVGGESPRAEAICIMSLIEGTILFLSEGKRWSADKDAVLETLFGFINAKYGENA